MKILYLVLLSLYMATPVILSARCCQRTSYTTEKSCCPSSCAFSCCCNSAPFCGPFPRPLPGQYASFKDNTRMQFWNVPPCAPRNESKERGYLYKGSWWDNAGVRYWAIKNSTNNTISVDGLEGGEFKDIPAGDVVNIARGESYGFRVQAPARRFELFNSDAHAIEVFINLRGDIDYRVELPKIAKRTKNNNESHVPKF